MGYVWVVGGAKTKADKSALDALVAVVSGKATATALATLAAEVADKLSEADLPAAIAEQIAALIASEGEAYSGVSQTKLMTAFLVDLYVSMRLAQVDTAIEGVNAFKLLTPATLKAVLTAYAAEAAEVLAGDDASLFVTPAALDGAYGRVLIALHAGLNRPGDNPTAFGEILVGEMADIAGLGAGIAASSTFGQVARRSGETVTATRWAYRIEPGRAYQLRAVVRRNLDPADPSGDTVRVGVQFLTAAKAAQSAVTISDLALEGVDGRTEVVAVIGRSPVVADVTAPVAAVYMRPFVQTYGGDGGETDIEVIEIRDVTGTPEAAPDVAALGAILNDIEAAIAALQIGEPDGVAPLDDDGLLPLANLPAAAVVAPYLGLLPALESFGSGVGLGDKAADQAAFNAALAAQTVVRLQAGVDYKLKTGLAFAALDDVGFEVYGRGRRPTITLQTGVGEFDLDTNADQNLFYAAHCAAIKFTGCTRPVLNGIDFLMQASAEQRLCKPLVLWDCEDIRDVGELTARDFANAVRGLFTLTSCRGGRIGRLVAYDCGVSASTFQPQISVVECDNDRPNGITSNVHFEEVGGESILLSGAALAAYGMQTDIFNNQAPGYSNHVVDHVWARGVGEVVDCFGSGDHYRLVQFEDAYLDAMKCIYGAQEVTVDMLKGRRTGNSAFAIYAGENFVNAGQHTGRIRLKDALVTEIGALGTPGFPKAGVQMKVVDGDPANFAIKDCQLSGYFEGSASGARMSSVVALITGQTVHTGNAFTGDGSGFIDGFSNQGAAKNGASRLTVNQTRSMFAQARLPGSTTVNDAARIPLTAVVTDRRGNYDAANSTMNVDTVCNVEIQFDFNLQQLGNERFVAILVRKDGSVVGDTAGREFVNRSGAALESLKLSATIVLPINPAYDDPLIGLDLMLISRDTTGGTPQALTFTEGYVTYSVKP